MSSNIATTINALSLGKYSTLSFDGIALFTMLATIAMAFIAWRALETWKTEFLGKKHIQIAEDFLIAFRDVEMLLSQMRNRVGSFSEKQEIMDFYKLENKSKDCSVLSPVYRMAKSKNTYNKWRDLENPARIYWGDRIKELYDNAYNIFQDITSFSWELYEFYSENNPSKEDKKEAVKRRKFIYYTENDEISERMRSIVKEVEDNLIPLLKNKQKKWKKI